MGEQFLALLQIVIPIFIVMGAGFGLRKIGLLSAEADQSLIRIVIFALTPSLAFDTIVGNEALQKPENWLLPPMLGFGSIFIGILLSRLVLPLLKFRTNAQKRTFVFTSAIQNYGYIPLPLCLPLFGRETMGVLFAFTLGVELAFWSIALQQLKGTGLRPHWRDFLNPVIIAIVSAMILNALGARQWMPETVKHTFHMLGVCAVPLGLLLSGALIADYLNRQTLAAGGRTILIAVLLRNGVLASLLMAGALWLPVDDTIRHVLVLQAAMPAAIFPIILTKVNDGDVPTALHVVLGTSLVGLITIPLWLSWALH